RRANQSAWRCGGRIGGEKCHLCIRFKVLPIYRLDTDRSLGALLATLAIGGIVDNSDPSPRHYTGEDAGRQVRGSANGRENEATHA
ncbi:MULTISPECIES: hypothetical protein, partial [unclassified Mesorhizobium]|uniref:hypothetical protein n=1 Tax=unclassified Mesorhizobium TaxID=325217 RepID=UPI00333D3E25